jgi:hypothetical protein
MAVFSEVQDILKPAKYANGTNRLAVIHTAPQECWQQIGAERLHPR